MRYRFLFFFFSTSGGISSLWCVWGSDGCSSDLPPLGGPGGAAHPREAGAHRRARRRRRPRAQPAAHQRARLRRADPEIGRASCRERGKFSLVAVLLKKKIKIQRWRSVFSNSEQK